jgi:hypothetical protein
VSEPIQPADPTSQPAATPEQPPARKKHTARTIVLSAIGALVGVVLANLIIGGIRGVAENAHIGPDRQQAKIESYVKATKAAVSLPKRLDAVTTWTDIKAEVGDIHYFYTIDSSVDPSRVSVDVLKPAIQSQVCGIPSAAAVLKDHIDFDYTYAIDGSTTKYEFTLVGDDCA